MLTQNSCFKSRVQWYGERGIVNSIVTHICAGDQKTFLSNVKKFLGTITWANHNRQSWIDIIEHAMLIVEFGLSDFGDPDLILVCKTGEAQTYCIFVEVKATTYMQSMKPNSSAMSLRGYNSSINGQLSLKYRFAKALSCSDDAAEFIKEPCRLTKQYAHQLFDHLSSGRRLKKSNNVHLLRECGVVGLSEEFFRFVALTWDREKDHVFFDDKETEGFLPVFLDENGHSAFEELRDRLGWVGFKQLEQDLKLYSNEEYMSARNTMIGDDEPSDDDYKKAFRRHVDQDEEIKYLAELIEKKFEYIELEKQKGSYSIKKQDKSVIGKILRRKGGIFIGVLVPEQDDIIERLPESISINKRIFHGTFVDVADDDLFDNEEIRIVISSIRNLKSRHIITMFV